MGQEWIEVIKKGNRAFSRRKYSKASVLFTQVLVETKRNLRQVNNLSRKNINMIQEFALCSRLAGKALMKNKEPHEAERVYLAAADKMRPFISNLNNPLPYRALLMTEYKLLVYDLANFYASNELFESLIAFTEKNTPTLKSWAIELQMISQSGRNLN